MAQHDYVLDNQGFGAMRADMNLALAAIASGNSGNTAPPTVYPGLTWVDTSGTPWLVKQYNGTQWVTLYGINATTHVSDIVRGGTDSKLLATTALANISNLQAITYAAATAITAAATTDITNTTDNIDLAGSAVTVTAITAPAALIGRRIRVRVTGSNITVNNGGGITVPNGVSASFNAGDLFTLVITAANTVRIEGVVPAGQMSQSFQVGGTVAANALTATLQPTPITFRSATAGSGSLTNLNVSTALSLTVPSGATLGTTNGVESTLALAAINNAGTVEYAINNVTGLSSLASEGIINTTALSASSNSANTWYSTTARTGVPYKLVGVLTSTQTTAGTYATAPSSIQGYGIAQHGQNVFIGLSTTGSAPLFACRAWVNFNGTGTVAIRGSGNVSSITDNGVGNYTVNFTTAMQDTNYATQVTITSVSTSTNTVHQISSQQTSGVSVVNYENGVLTDNSQICVTVHR